MSNDSSSPSSAKTYFVYGLTAATTGVIAFSFYKSVTAQWATQSRGYATDERADSPPGFLRKLYPDDPKDGKQDVNEKEVDKPQEASYLQQWADWTTIGDRIKNFSLIPEWAQQMPEYIIKLQKDLSDEPGTLAQEIWNAARDGNLHPEISRDATVRVSNDLCPEEQDFLAKRRKHVIKALAKYLDIPEKDIHPDDVPVIGMCGSGGGLRAMVAGSSSYLCAQEDGLLDCVTYTAGVSGSCWLQALYHSSIGQQDFGKLIEHLKSRISTHIAFPPPVLKLLTSAPTNKYLLAGGLEKYKGYQDADFGLVDIYGLLLGARLLVPKGSLAVNHHDIKLSYQRKYVDQGQNPLPIYSAVRHELPLVNENSEQDVTFMKKEAQKNAWFQWFEFSPYEFFSEEFGSGIPTWAVGRRFDKGHSIVGENAHYLPEIRLPLLMGIFGSAFCATLSHYYKEIRPLVGSLPGFESFDSMISERDEDLVKMHPVAPAQIPNFAVNMKESLPTSCPESVHKSKTIQLMDAGMSNNLPIYPLLRPGREVDVVIAFDASADIKQDNWLRAVDGYAKQRQIRGWPLGAGWPKDGESAPGGGSSTQDIRQSMDEASGSSVSEANAKQQRAADDQADQQKQTPQKASSERPASDSKEKDSQHDKNQNQNTTDLGYCNVWVGRSSERTSDDEPPPSRVVESDWEISHKDAGIAVVYFPFMANPAVKGVDPTTSDFMSTWNFIYTPEDVDKVVALARANFREGAEQTRRTIRAVYERKRKMRLEKEEQEGRGAGFWRIAGRQTLM